MLKRWSFRMRLKDDHLECAEKMIILTELKYWSFKMSLKDDHFKWSEKMIIFFPVKTKFGEMSDPPQNGAVSLIVVIPTWNKKIKYII